MNAMERANRAKAILEDPLYQESYELCRLAIHDRIEKLPLAEVGAAEDLRKCLRLLRDVRANMIEALNTGKVAAFRIAEDEKVKKNPLKGLFR
jgi:hypothetical protein